MVHGVFSRKYVVPSVASKRRQKGRAWVGHTWLYDLTNWLNVVLVVVDVVRAIVRAIEIVATGVGMGRGLLVGPVL